MNPCRKHLDGSSGSSRARSLLPGMIRRTRGFASWFWNTDGAADHRASADGVKESEGVKNPESHAKGSEKDMRVYTAFPVGDPEQGHDGDAGRNRRSFVILYLPCSVGQ